MALGASLATGIGDLNEAIGNIFGATSRLKKDKAKKKKDDKEREENDDEMKGGIGEIYFALETPFCSAIVEKSTVLINETLFCLL